jgi:uncharacterized protein (DUF302 family)
MLAIGTDQRVESIEGALRRAAQHNQASVLASTHVGQHLGAGAADAVTFSLCHPELYSALLAAEIRLAAFLPCRIAAYSREGKTFLETDSPVEFCRLLNRPDLAPLLEPLESMLQRVMQEAAVAGGEPAHAASMARRGGLGATEDQVNLRGSVPQRIDCHGTKVEELAGTGHHDAQGG